MLSTGQCQNNVTLHTLGTEASARVHRETWRSLGTRQRQLRASSFELPLHRSVACWLDKKSTDLYTTIQHAMLIYPICEDKSEHISRRGGGQTSGWRSGGGESGRWWRLDKVGWGRTYDRGQLVGMEWWWRHDWYASVCRCVCKSQEEVRKEVMKNEVKR